MNLLDVIKKRCSIRQYTSTPVEPEKLNYLLEAIRMAPSAVNFQPWYFIVIREPEGCARIRECYEREWFATAPMYIIACADLSQSWKRASDNKDHADIDVAIATEHLCLAATEQGLGTCWVCNFNVPKCKALFNLPENIEPIALIPVGYPARPSLCEEAPKKRKPLQEIVKWETF